MMGDGVIDLPLIRSWMESAGYRGFHEVEIFSPNWWKREADDVLGVIKRRHQECCMFSCQPSAFSQGVVLVLADR